MRVIDNALQRAQLVPQFIGELIEQRGVLYISRGMNAGNWVSVSESGGAGSAIWGSIIGDIDDQADLLAKINEIIAAQDALVFKGLIDCSTNPNYPAADAGWVYRASVAGKIGGASGVNVEVGDTFYCLVDGTVSGNQATVGSAWGIIQTNLDGVVTGPLTSTDDFIPQWSGTTGQILKQGLDPAAFAYLASQNVFTAEQTIELGPIGFTDPPASGLYLEQDVASTALVQHQNSPSIAWSATVWNLNTVQSDEWKMAEHLIGFQNIGSGSEARFYWAFQVNDGGFNQVAKIDSFGNIAAEGDFFAGSVAGSNKAFKIGGTLAAFGENGLAFDSPVAQISNYDTSGALEFVSNNDTVAAFRLSGFAALTSGDLFDGLVPAAGFTGSYLKFGTSSDGATFAAVKFEVNASGDLTIAGALAASNFSGTHAGTSSGTNTGDQTISLTGDVTGSGVGSFAATIANDAVSLAKMANVATATVFYRKTAGTGDPEVQTLATLKTDLGLSGTNTGDQTTVSGNAGSATVLQTARNINGVSFNGSSNITVPAAGSTLTDTVPVGKGGTGATTLAAHGVLIGNGTTEVAVSGAGTTGQVLTSNGASADPTFESIPVSNIIGEAHFDGANPGSASVFGNVGYVSSAATGVYKVYFATTLADVNYGVTIGVGNGSEDNWIAVTDENNDTDKCYVTTKMFNPGVLGVALPSWDKTDANRITVVIYKNP